MTVTLFFDNFTVDHCSETRSLGYLYNRRQKELLLFNISWMLMDAFACSERQNPLWRVGTKLIFMFEYREPQTRETRQMRRAEGTHTYEKGA